MTPNEPTPPPNIQMTPVEFSPPSSDAVGSIVGTVKRTEMQFPVFIPLVIVLLTLNFTTLRDIVILNRRMMAINQDNAPNLDLLSKAGKQSEFLNSMRASLDKLSVTDPVAARINAEMFGTVPDKAANK